MDAASETASNRDENTMDADEKFFRGGSLTDDHLPSRLCPVRLSR